MTTTTIHPVYQLFQECANRTGDTRVCGVDVSRAFVRECETAYPNELDWAEEVMLRHTTYSRRRYGNMTYCYADIDVRDENNRPVGVDPWPAINYSRASLLAQLICRKVVNPAIRISA